MTSAFYLHSSQVTGTIPTEYGNLEMSAYFYLRQTKISGTIPTELGQMNYMTNGLYLDYSSLTGQVTHQSNHPNSFSF